MRTVLTLIAALAIAVPAAAQESPSAQALAHQAEQAAKQREKQKERESERARTRERVAIAMAQRGQDLREEQTEQFTRSVKIGSNGAIDLYNLSGSVTVTRGSGNEARIDVVKKARARTVEDAREMLKQVQVEINELPGRAEVRTRYPHQERSRPPQHRSVHVSVSYTISAPAAARLTLRTMAGDVAVSDISGEVTAEPMSGSIRIDRVSHLLTAKTASGDVTVTDAGGESGMDVRSMSGEVSMKQVKGRTLSVGSISGGVSLLDVRFDRVDASTMSGDIVYQGPLSKTGRYGLKSHSGNVRLVLDGATGFQVDATTFSGGVQSDVPVSGHVQAGDTPVGRHPREPRQRTLRGVHGDGSAVLDLTTFSGNIVIAKR